MASKCLHVACVLQCLLSGIMMVASAPTCSMTSAGQKAVHIPGAKGRRESIGCRAGGVKECCFCVDDMAACVKAHGGDICKATNDARLKQGFNGCHVIETTPETAPTLASTQACSMTTAGQKALYIPDGKGTGCNAGGVKGCCYCVDDMKACVDAFGSGPCKSTNEARRKDGFDGCDATETRPELAITEQTCSMTAAGQKALYIPGGKGTGCNAGGVKGCCFCVDDMEACVKAFGFGPCNSTKEARRKDGFDGCAKAKAETCTTGEGTGCATCVAVESRKTDADCATCNPGYEISGTICQAASPSTCEHIKAVGQKAVYILGATGVGCSADGCCFCIDNMTACVKSCTSRSCQSIYDARRKEGFLGCKKANADYTYHLGSSCARHYMAAIRTREECEEAAKTLGHSTGIQGVDPDYKGSPEDVRGCYLHNGTSQFRFNEYTSIDTCHHGQVCVCKTTQADDLLEIFKRAATEWVLAALAGCAAIFGSVNQARRKNQKKKRSFCLNFEEDKETKRLASIPRVTIFECIGLVKEFDKHCSDLLDQMKGLAKDHAIALGMTLAGSDDCLENRLLRLKDLLHDRIKTAEIESEAAGALRRFVSDQEGSPVTRLGWWLKLYPLALVVFSVQTVGLFYMTYAFSKDLWLGHHVHRANFPMVLVTNMLIFNFYHEGHLFNAGCFGNIRGFGFNATISAGGFWTLVGDLTFLMSTLFTVAAANTVIWTRSHMLDAIAYSALILIIYRLDQIVLAVFVINPEQFRDWAIRSSDLLGYCPQSIADLVDSGAGCDTDLWRIETDSEGKLQKYERNPRNNDTEASLLTRAREKTCETRSMPNRTRILQPVEFLLGLLLLGSTIMLPCLGLLVLTRGREHSHFV